jgi:type I restriction enzyme S subunit
MNDAGEMSVPDVPPDWELVRLKYAVDSIETGNRDSSFRPSDDDPGILSIGGEHFDSQGEWRLDSPRYISTDTYHSMKRGKVKQGDTLLVKDGATIGKTAYVDEVPENRATANEHVYIISPSQMVASRLVAYQLSSRWVQRQIQLFIRGSAQSGLPSTFADEVLLSCPPTGEQSTIVDFLDRRTARIDALVTKQKRLLEFLEEKRQAVLDRLLEQAETEGNARLKYLVDFLPGFAFSSDSFSKNSDDVRLLRGINVGIGEINWDDVEYWPNDKVSDYERYLLEPGDIVLGMDRPWISDGIRIAQMGESDCPALLVQRVLRIRAKSEVHQKYVRMVLESERFRQYFEPITTGVSVPHISQKQVGEFRIPLPSKSHQASILSQWESFQGEKHQLEQSIKKSIGLLEEKRQALITAAVTGQIDVTEEHGAIQDQST